MWRKRSKKRDAGFSLVEALVALAVFATAGVGLITMQTQSVSTFTTLESRTFANLVAQNVLVELAANSAAPNLGQRAGETEMGGKVWTWRVDVAATLEANTRRVRVIVLAPGTQTIGADMTAFVSVQTGEG
jgi:general secretion pathway protein I